MLVGNQDAVGVQRLIRRGLRREMPDPRVRGAEVELLRLVVERPGVIAQSAMFGAVFYGIQIIWERDAGIVLSRDRLTGLGQALTCPR
ncbi:hypothetical protein [Streptomyces sp. AS02]|uniref:hypothetical protein n=1 Tax=Streptomyces sp. AS02 TaxID=2938946 RepID=UPI0020217461|nr:hypothetical protein [Streptomyces sp. AS02]MCL8017384.1 hypothetical protein [Streptomyces sp. AS02]